MYAHQNDLQTFKSTCREREWNSTTTRTPERSSCWMASSLSRIMQETSCRTNGLRCAKLARWKVAQSAHAWIIFSIEIELFSEKTEGSDRSRLSDRAKIARVQIPHVFDDRSDSFRVRYKSVTAKIRLSAIKIQTRDVHTHAPIAVVISVLFSNGLILAIAHKRLIR